MSTHVFNVSGDKPEFLSLTLALALKFEGGRVHGWYTSQEHGLVLCWGDSRTVIQPGNSPYAAFPAPMTAEFLTPMVSAWLEGDEAKSMPLSDEDGGYPDGDGSNVRGWRVHLIPGNSYAVCAVKPSYCYYGK